MIIIQRVYKKRRFEVFGTWDLWGVHNEWLRYLLLLLLVETIRIAYSPCGGRRCGQLQAKPICDWLNFRQISQWNVYLLLNFCSTAIHGCSVADVKSRPAPWSPRLYAAILPRFVPIPLLMSKRTIYRTLGHQKRYRPTNRGSTIWKILSVICSCICSF